MTQRWRARWLTVLLLASGTVSADGLEARAVIKAIDRAVLSGELAARVASLPLRPGDAFQKGDLLVELDCRLYKAQEAKVAAEIKAARSKRDNARQLKALNSIGELDVALAQSELEQALAEGRIAHLNTQRCRIHAPWNGRVVNLLVNAQENIRVQQELIEIVDDGQLEAEVVVPSAWLAWLEPGQALSFMADDVERQVDAHITAISPAIDAVSQTVLLRAELPTHSGLIPGMSATARFEAPNQL